MDNLQKANIYIINIGAEQLANPNWDIEAQRLFYQYKWNLVQQSIDTENADMKAFGQYDYDVMNDSEFDYEDNYNDINDSEFDDEDNYDYIMKQYEDSNYSIDDDNSHDMDDNYVDNNNVEGHDVDSYNTNDTDDMSKWMKKFLYEDISDVSSDKYRAYLKEKLEEISAPDLRTDFYKINKNKEERDLLYSGTLPISLDILKLQKEFPKELYTMNKDTEKKIYSGSDIFKTTNSEKLYTDAIINVTFNRALYEIADELKFTKVNKDTTKRLPKFRGKILKSVHKLREKFYDEGVTLRFGDSLVKYVKYKRSASKAREGAHLFIKKELYEKMSDWEEFGIRYAKNEKAPLVAIKAYESLTSSRIEKTVTIHPNEILLIDDVEMKVKINASVTTEQKNGDIIAKDKDDHVITNKIWDGQSLADTSLFGNEQKGMMLLRNSFFKSCAFNTNIQLWFDYMARDKEFITDMFGRDVKRTDIKLITTPSSLKLLKFSDKFPGVSKPEKEKNSYEKWLDTISSEFGVCKHETASRFGEFQQLSYQIVNSLPLSKEEIKELLKYDLEHIEKMKNDVTYFKSTIKFKDPVPSDALMLMLLEVNNNMWRTKMVKDYVRDKVDNYIANLRKGHIKVKGSDYAVLFGNPLEMLQYALSGKEADIKVRPLIGKQVYCSIYENGTKLAGFRNPHITMGNVLSVDNIYKEEFDMYFNLTDNIVISNAYDSDIMERLQGQDYDSDTLLLSSEPILAKAAEACQNDNFRVPINGIKAKNIDRKYNTENEVEIDQQTARNKIGLIVNLSQLLNSYYWDWDSRNDKGEYDGLLKEYYTQTSILSSLSQIEIDRAKKNYITEADEFLKKLKQMEYNGKLLLPRREKSFTKNEINYQTLRAVPFIAPIRKSSPGIDIPSAVGALIAWKGDVDTLRSKLSLDEEGFNALTRFTNYLCRNDRDVLICPKFFEYCGIGKRNNFTSFNTPMDYLQQIIDGGVQDKKRDVALDILDIIPKPDFRKADNYQIPKIIEACEKADKRIKALQSKQKTSDSNKNRRIREIENDVIQKLQNWKINENTIRVILYKAFDENKGFHDKNYSKMKRHLASWLYQAHPKTFKQVIAMSKGE